MTDLRLLTGALIWYIILTEHIILKNHKAWEKRPDVRVYKWMGRWISRLDRSPLWWTGFLLLAVTFAPYLILREGSVFPVHDQLDETLMTYVLNARHFQMGGAEMFPEILGGINASGMQPSAVLFILLYRFLPVFWAFVLQYLIVSAAGFFGMYGSVKEITGSSILAVAMAGCFCLLPVQPVYGLSVSGVPLLLSCFLCLYQGKHVAGSFAGILFFGLTTHLVLIGYVVLGVWLLAILWLVATRRRAPWVCLGFLGLMGIYIGVNHSLFGELLLGKSNYVSHREELVNYAMPFWETVKDVFLNSAQHAPSLHRSLILPICAALILGTVFRKRVGEKGRQRLLAAWLGLAALAGIALLYGVCHLPLVVDFKNSRSGFLRYFQLERFYWLYPAGWYLEAALCFSLWWGMGKENAETVGTEAASGTAPEESGKDRSGWMPILKLLALACLLFPTLQEIKPESYFYLNVNQINNGSGITGYITWESYYAEDLMEQIEEAIGRDMAEYRVAHLGMSPAPALMHGFYTVDGYSNNYPLEYKHLFRRVIAKELEKNEQTRLYFDEWGSRCYLFNGTTGNAWMLGKTLEIGYEGLEFDMEALKELGCGYLFSAGEILDSEEMGLTFLGHYETDASYWGIWLYQL
ncbi:MAG: DUF6044 family protein [Butyrivibrio sp.]|nr:DUF6044 family protein [Butyrivibrio sp.]MCM1344624.1 DUF6044 family protein [Muribaculaceae bacterium]